MSKMFQVYGIGQALIPVLPPPLKFETTPNSNQTNYEIGQVAYTGSPGSYTFYIYAGAGVWELLDVSTGVLDTLTTDDSTVVVPVAGNINLKGSGSTTTVGSGADATVELTGLTNHAVLVGAGTTTITKLAVGTTGQVLTASTAADPAFAALGTNSGLTAHGVLLGEGNSAIAATSPGTTGQFLVSNGASADPTFQTATPQLTVTPVAGTSQAMTSNNSYIANAAGQTTFTLPATSAVGDILQIIGSALNTGGWKVTYTTGQIIWGPGGSSTITTGNAATGAAAAQVMKMSCVVANTTWVITSNSGTITLT